MEDIIVNNDTARSDKSERNIVPAEASLETFEVEFSEETLEALKEFEELLD